VFPPAALYQPKVYESRMNTLIGIWSFWGKSKMEAARLSLTGRLQLLQLRDSQRA
jgi:hypothetical protein